MQIETRGDASHSLKARITNVNVSTVVKGMAYCDPGIDTVPHPSQKPGQDTLRLGGLAE